MSTAIPLTLAERRAALVAQRREVSLLEDEPFLEDEKFPNDGAQQCRACGLRGAPHANPAACIAALRDRLSAWE